MQTAMAMCLCQRIYTNQRSSKQ